MPMSRNVMEMAHLTAREAQVLRLVALGMSAKEAAKELLIAPCTVERHIENVRLKTRTRNRPHMIAYVLTEGLLPDEVPDERCRNGEHDGLVAYEVPRA